MYEVRKAGKESASRCYAAQRHTERGAVLESLVVAQVNTSRLLQGRSVVQESIVHLRLVPTAAVRVSIYSKVALVPAEVQEGCSFAQVRTAG
jgi:hypothetical protein